MILNLFAKIFIVLNDFSKYFCDHGCHLPLSNHEITSTCQQPLLWPLTLSKQFFGKNHAELENIKLFSVTG
jgi:hypothetical protein